MITNSLYVKYKLQMCFFLLSIMQAEQVSS